MKNLLIPFIIMLVLFSSCLKDEIEPLGKGEAAPFFSKKLITFDKKGGTDTISVNMNITFFCFEIESTDFGYIGYLSDDEDHRDTCNVYIKKGFLTKIESDWFSLVRTKKEPKVIKISVKPILDDLKSRKVVLPLTGKFMSSNIVIEQIDSPFTVNMTRISFLYGGYGKK